MLRLYKLLIINMLQRLGGGKPAHYLSVCFIQGKAKWLCLGFFFVQVFESLNL